MPVYVLDVIKRTVTGQKVGDLEDQNLPATELEELADEDKIPIQDSSDSNKWKWFSFSRIASKLQGFRAGDTIETYRTDTPDGWLECNGQAVDRTTYSALFAAISTRSGAGNGSTTFNLPDRRGRTSVGAGQGTGLTSRQIGAKGGRETHSLTTPELAEHNHTSPGTGTSGLHTHGAPYSDVTGRLSGSGANFRIGGPLKTVSQTDARGSHSHSVTINNTGEGRAHNNMQPFEVCRVLIFAG